jgi:hypothetical protein
VGIKIDSNIGYYRLAYSSLGIKPLIYFVLFVDGNLGGNFRE